MTIPKSNPIWFTNVALYNEGRILCFVNSTKSKLEIDLWLGNHPFYNKSSKLVDTEGRIEKFNKKYNLVLT